MRLQRYSILLYIVFVLLISAQSIWWVIYLAREGANFTRYELQRFKTDQIHAVLLINSVPSVAANPAAALAEAYPHLEFLRGPEGPEVRIRAEARDAAVAEGQRRRRMFIWEGAFFLILLLGGGTLVTLAYLREQQFKRSRDLFLAGVTHEFKTPLSSLLLYAETLERPELEEKARSGILERMEQDIERLRDMVDQILAVSRSDSFSFKGQTLMDLGEEAEAILEEMSPHIAAQGGTLSKRLPRGFQFRGDRQAFAVALRNLLGNALHYSETGVAIDVTLDESERWRRLAVRDNGPGIPRQEHKKIFRSFYRVGEAGRRPPGRRGTGLGLFLVKRNIEAMGGRVELESREGAGSTFTLLLPPAKNDGKT